MPKKELSVRRNVLLIFLMIAVTLSLIGKEKPQADELPPVYAKWLNEEVVYIITPTEREVFLQLQTNRERDVFIEAFWKQRDTLFKKPEGASRKEHYDRMDYANRFYGRGTPKRGWQTDRGRTYIILGEPSDIQRFEGKTQTYPAEIWFYQGKTDIGLPPGFNLVFYQENAVGEYELYSPARDGPMALLASYFGDSMDYLEAYKQLRELEPDLAQVSLSLIPGEGMAYAGRPSLSSDLLIQRVDTVPERQIKDRYAQKFLEYKDIVEVEYSTNYIDSLSSVKVIKDPSGMYFVHYAIDPEKLSVDSYEDRYFTTMKINGTVSSLDNKIIYQFGKDFSINFDRERLKSILRQPVSLRDMFPLIPGDYRLSILVRNEASKEFTSLESTLLIPGEEDGLQMSSLILGYSMEKDKKQQRGIKPFQIGNNQILFHANNMYTKQDTLVTALQIHGMKQTLKDNGEIKFTFLKDDEEVHSLTRTIAEYPDLPNILEQFPLRDYAPSHYRVLVSLFVEGKEVLSASEDFAVTYAEAIVRPWVYSKVVAETKDPVYDFILGTQFYNSGQIAKAGEYLESAFQSDPNSIDYALNLARIYMTLSQYNKIESILLPFTTREELPAYEILFVLGKAYQNSGQLDKALVMFDRALSNYGFNINLLNSIGECYFNMGEPDEALNAWEKSLEINPDQPEIQKKVKALRQKK